MPVILSSLPTPTPYDPAEDAAGSADPLGTLGGSERLAEILLPGLTARMWRARLLTFAVVAADIADAVVRRRDDQEDLRLRARLAFERIFVASLVRCEEKDAGKYSGLARRVPGSRTARRALHADDEPLTRQNFIKGQVVNGPSGVMARLARELGLIDAGGQLASRGHELRSCWGAAAADDAEAELGAGDRRRNRQAEDAVLKHLDGDSWPTHNTPIWPLLADSLRPDKIPVAERRIIFRFLNTEPQYGIRPRVLELLLEERCQAVHRHSVGSANRGEIERRVLLEGVMPLLGTGDVDAHISVAIRAIDAYEQVSELLTAAFDGLLLGLRDSGGAASAAQLLQQGKLIATLKRLRARLARVVPPIRDLLPLMVSRGPFVEQDIPKLMTQIMVDAERGAVSVEALLEIVLARHERVQRDKRKPTWVDRSASWTLMPGTPVSEDRGPDGPTAFIHPYRVVNAYSLMVDLRLLKGGRSNGQDEGE